MAANETTTKFKVDISDLKKNIQEANRQIRLANAEFKAASAGLDNWAKSADGVSAKITQTQKVLSSQKTILADYEKQLELIVREYGANSKEADEMRIKIENQKAAVAKSEKALSDYQKQLVQLKEEEQAAADATEKENTELGKLRKTIEDQEKSLSDLKESYANVVLEQGKNSDAAKNLASQIGSLSSDLKENKAKLSEVTEASDDLDNSMNDTSKGGISAFGVALGNLISNVVAAAVSKLKELVSETINVGKSFDTGMSKVAAVSGATGDELQALRDKAKEVGAQTKFSATEAADAMNYMAMAGWKTEQMIDGVDGIMNLAAASGAELAVTSDIVTDSLTAFGMSAEESGHFADVLAAASSNSNTNVEMLGESFKFVAPLAGSMGASVEDVSIALGLMANAGIKSAMAGNTLKGAITSLMSPTKEQAAAMQKLGFISTETIQDINFEKVEKAEKSVEDATYSLNNAQIKLDTAIEKYGRESSQAQIASNNLEKAQSKLTKAQETLAKEQAGVSKEIAGANTLMMDSEGNMRSLGGIIDSLRSKMGKVNVELTDAEGNTREYDDIIAELSTTTEGLAQAEQLQAAAQLFGRKNMTGMLAIINASDEDYKKLTDSINNSAGAAKNMADIMEQNLGGDLTKLGSKFESIQIAIYEKLRPALTAGVELLSGLLDGVEWLVQHGDEVTTVITAIAAAVGAYLAYTTAVTVMTKGWAALTVVTKAQAAAQAVLNAVMNANPIGLVVSAIAALVTAFVMLWNKSEDFRNFWLGLWDSIQEVAGKAIEAVANFFKGAWEKIKSAWNAVTGFFSGIWDSIQESASNLVEAVADFFKSGYNAIVNFFQPVITFFSEAFSNIIGFAEGCWTIVKTVWSAVGEWFNDNVVQPVKKFFSGLWDGITSAASAAWNVIKGVWNSVSGWFKNAVIQPVSNFFGGMWDGLKKGAQAAWDGITGVFSHVADWFKDKFSRAWQAVKDVFSTGGKIFDGIKEGIVDAFKSVVNAIIRGINAVIAIPFNAINGILEKIRDVSILGVEPFKNLIHTFTVPQIPQLKRGGVLKRGQIGMLEGDGAEAVVPLENNKRWISATAAALKKSLEREGVIGARVDGGQTVNNSSNVTNNYSFNQTNNSPVALSRLELYRQTKNLLALRG